MNLFTCTYLGKVVLLQTTEETKHVWHCPELLLEGTAKLPLVVATAVTNAAQIPPLAFAGAAAMIALWQGIGMLGGEVEPSVNLSARTVNLTRNR